MCPFMKCNCPYYSSGQCTYNACQQNDNLNPDYERSYEENFEDMDEPYDSDGVYMPSPYSIEVDRPYPNMNEQQYPDMYGKPYPDMKGKQHPDMHGNENIPKGPPPMHVPPKKPAPSLKAVDQGAIKNCKYRYIYIWPRRGRGFWAYLTYVGRTSVAGFRWSGGRWIYFGMSLREIQSFQCY